MVSPISSGGRAAFPHGLPNPGLRPLADFQAYGLTAPRGLADDYAASPLTKGAVPVGGSITASLDMLRDHDWFAVDLQAGRTYALRQTGLTLVDPLLRLRTSTTVVATNDDAEGTRNSLITYTPTQTRRFYLDAGAYLDAYTGTYSVSVTDLTPRDDYTQGTDTTGVVPINGASSGALERTGDHDWFAVTVRAGASYDFRLNGVGLSDPVLRLRDGIGQQIALNDDAEGTRNSLISHTAVSSGVLYLDAGAFGDSLTGAYSISATEILAPPPPVPTGYSSTDGYGEVNVARALDQLTGQPLVRQPALGGVFWGLDRVGAPTAWAAGITGAGVTVAVVDTGVDLSHPDLAGNIWTNSGEIAGNGIDDDLNGFIDDIRGWDFVQNDNAPTDANGHGTHVAGTIAAINNGAGQTGVAYDARIMPVRVLDGAGSGTFTAIANGIRYAARNGAGVINLSLGGSSGTADLLAAIREATALGSVVVMAAGNSGTASPGYPAAYAVETGLAVGAVDAAGALASFSNRAGTTKLDYVTAPGVNIYSTTRGGTYGTLSGTSMASPHVAGVVALLRSFRPTLTPGEIEALLVASASNSVVVPPLA